MIIKLSPWIKALTLFCLLLSFSAQATLLISPIKLVIEDRVRAKELILINTSKKAVTYRLSWEQKTVSEKGGYQMLTAEQIETFPIASSMIRFSPKQVKLKPGERQVVKLSIRRPKDLKNGEYRSHLKLHAVPDKRNLETNADGSIKINMLFSYVLPVVVRKGEASSNVVIDNVQLISKTAKSKAKVLVSLANSTQYSTTGNVIAYLTGVDGKEEIVARLNDFTFYPDKRKTQARLIWSKDCQKGCDGRLRVAYEGVKKKQGTIFAEYDMNLNSDSFQ